MAMYDVKSAPMSVNDVLRNSGRFGTPNEVAIERARQGSCKAVDRTADFVNYYSRMQFRVGFRVGNIMDFMSKFSE